MVAAEVSVSAGTAAAAAQGVGGDEPATNSPLHTTCIEETNKRQETRDNKRHENLTFSIGPPLTTSVGRPQLAAPMICENNQVNDQLIGTATWQHSTREATTQGTHAPDQESSYRSHTTARHRPSGTLEWTPEPRAGTNNLVALTVLFTRPQHGPPSPVGASASHGDTHQGMDTSTSMAMRLR